MNTFQKILHKLNGCHYPQEYLCMVKEQQTKPLRAFFVFENKVVKDITIHHLFTGYSPLIFVLPSINEIDLNKQSIIKIIYSISSLEMEATVSKKDIVAILFLKKIKEQKTDNSSIYYFEGVNGKHKFLSSFHQFIILLNNQLFNRKGGNVFLKNNLYKQVQIAYATPRVISLVTVSYNNLFNLFPTDLHGQINEDYYIISLRYQGNACKQVEQAKKIVLSNVDASYYKEAYNLGKNHMQPLKEKSNFVFSEENSYTLKLPLPPNVIECRELELKDSFIHGIHKLLLFKILNHQRSQNPSTTLAHVHNVYATWRYKQGLGNYFFFL
jgi:hypothetical protein